MAKRKGISKRTRFEVFKRDNFKCRYCGNGPPNVLIEVDHIVAVANGGTHELDNFITSCETCNAGKSDRPTLQASVISMAAKWREFENNLQPPFDHYWDVCPAEDVERVIELFLASGIPEHGIEFFIGETRFITDEISRCSEQAYEDFEPPAINPWSYFCGMCWLHLWREKSNDR